MRQVGILIVNDGDSDSTGSMESEALRDANSEGTSIDEEVDLSEEDLSKSYEETDLTEEDPNLSEEDPNLPEEGEDTLTRPAGDVATTAAQDQTVPLDPKDDSDNVEKNEVEEALQEESSMFMYEELTQEIKDRITGKSYGDNCKVPFEELRYVKVLYWGFDDETHTGELIVNKAIAQDIVDIFEELYEQKYPIERIELVDEYDADDNASMAANNTSAFNYRVVDGTDRLSNHSYGLAIDINPQYNPYIREMDGETVITPTNGIEYADRSLDCEHYIRKDDICYNAFVSRGFTWGGDWKTVKDYQHFQKKID